MTAQKKVIVRRFLGDSLAGYLPSSGFLTDDAVSLLDLSGHVTPIPLSELKFVAYVRNFNLSDSAEIDRTLRRTFLARPRSDGLWVRVTFRTGDTMEGVTAPGLPLLDELLDTRGLQLIPPDTRSNTQRVYIPRAAMTQLDLLSVVSTVARQRTVAAAKRKGDEQNELFPAPNSNS